MSPETEAYLKWATLAIAVFGALLSVFNAWRAFSGDRVKLRVRIRVTLTTLHKPSIELVNLSSFPITVMRAGWAERRGSWPRRRWIQVTPHDAAVGANLIAQEPVEVSPRRPVVIEFTHPTSFAKVLENQRVFVSTACGTTVLSPFKSVVLFGILGSNNGQER